MLRIGLTGGIGCGKSSVSRLFAARGIPVIDADEAARRVVEPGSPALQAIAEQLGERFLTASRELDRAALRQHIFTYPEAKATLEVLLHPQIRAWMLAEAQRHTAAPYLIFAVPLLLESGWQSLVDRILVVDCSPEQQRQRAVDRDGVGAAQIEAIIASQLPREQRLSAADDICHNDAGMEQLEREVERLHHLYLSMAATL